MSQSQSNAREANRNSMEQLEKNDTGNLSGGVLPRDLFDEFYQRVQEEAELLNIIRTETLSRQQEAIPKIGVGERIMREQSEGQAPPGGTNDAVTGAVELDPVKTTIPYELTSEAVEDTVDDVVDVLLSKYEQQFRLALHPLVKLLEQVSGQDAPRQIARVVLFKLLHAVAIRLSCASLTLTHLLNRELCCPCGCLALRSVVGHWHRPLSLRD